MKNRVVWPHLLDYAQLWDQMLRKTSSEKSSRLARALVNKKATLAKAVWAKFEDLQK